MSEWPAVISRGHHEGCRWDWNPRSQWDHLGRERRLGRKDTQAPQSPTRSLKHMAGCSCLQETPSLISGPFRNIQDSVSAIKRLQLARDCLSDVFCKLWHIGTLSDLHFCSCLKAQSAQLGFWRLCPRRAVFPRFLELHCLLVATSWQAITLRSLLVWDPQTLKVAFYPNSYFKLLSRSHWAWSATEQEGNWSVTEQQSLIFFPPLFKYFCNTGRNCYGDRKYRWQKSS